jgi:dethiobiotin synthase
MRILVTGTGFGVGKTWVACELARAIQDAGRQVVAIKPVETGCSDQPSPGQDGARLALASGQSAPGHAIVRLPESVDPALAGESPGDEIDFDALVLKIERFADQAEYALIEGTGGLLTPVTWEWNMADVARALGAVALVVGIDQVGTINHTLLTLSALELAGLPCLGVILTPPEVPDSSTGKNAAAIARLSGIDRILTLPMTADQQAAAHTLQPVLSWCARIAAPA